MRVILSNLKSRFPITSFALLSFTLIIIRNVILPFRLLALILINTPFLVLLPLSFILLDIQPPLLSNLGRQLRQIQSLLPASLTTDAILATGPASIPPPNPPLTSHQLLRHEHSAPRPLPPPQAVAQYRPRVDGGGRTQSVRVAYDVGNFFGGADVEYGVLEMVVYFACFGDEVDCFGGSGCLLLLLLSLLLLLCRCRRRLLLFHGNFTAFFLLFSMFPFRWSSDYSGIRHARIPLEIGKNFGSVSAESAEVSNVEPGFLGGA
mmetsp:Transcript_25536/g.52639  ORF Transcript_25536/g.52639 Transcript_25536/m.52639 type:complete len:263 (-) Transcript_25536:70-858(-)